MRNRKGFTLIEVIVVVCILAILAGVGVFSYVRYIKNAQQKACLVNRTELSRGYEDFRDLFGETDMAAYVSAEVGGLNKICPAGGACNVGQKDGRPYIFCDLHEQGGSETVMEPVEPDPPGSGSTETDPSEETDPPESETTSWVLDKPYEIGDTIHSGNLVLRCHTGHKSTENGNGCNPADQYHKNVWQVAGYVDGKTYPYDKKYSYAYGAKVLFNNATYECISTDGTNANPNNKNDWQLVTD